MTVEEIYDEFRDQYPEVTKAADARHVEIWGSVEPDAAFLWFESLAGALNAQMGVPERRAELSGIFEYFDMKFRTGGKEVKNCIDVSFVEQLFWNVGPGTAAPVWDILPMTLQRLYIDFHGHPPKLD